jgi:GNAT superfamily N-acetyltransferase
MASSEPNEEIIVSPVTSLDDFNDLTTTEAQAFSHDKMISLMFPYSSKSHAHNCARHKKSFLEDPTSKYIKAYTPSGETIGFGKWYFYLTPEAIAGSSKPWPLGESEKEYINIPMAEHYFHNLQERKNKVFEGKKHALMAILVVKPGWQRKGVGQKILEWGLAECDKQGLGVWIDASPVGKGLYEKCGWKQVDTLVMELSKWGGEKDVVSRTVCMVRDPIVKSSSE